MGTLIVIVVAVIIGALLVAAIFLDRIIKLDNILDDFKNDEHEEII